MTIAEEMLRLDAALESVNAKRTILAERQTKVQNAIMRLRAKREDASRRAQRTGQFMSEKSWGKIGRDLVALQSEFNDIACQMTAIKAERALLNDRRARLDRQALAPAFQAIAGKVLAPDVYQHIYDLAAAEMRP
jgi:chromosome segregation ATPase